MGVKMRMPYPQCPRFENCSCNICPLDPLVNEKIKIPEDEKCLLRKFKRLQIGSQFSELKFRGLTSREYYGMKNLVWSKS